MADHEELRLEDKDGFVIAYFAPSFEWEDVYQNDITSEGLPGPGQNTLLLDLSQWTGELTIQGAFESSQNLPQEHRLALDNMGFSLPVSAQEQANYAIEQLVYEPTPPYNLYVNENEYTANSPGEINVAGGTYPNVTVTEIRTPEEAGLTRMDYLFRFQVGFEQS